MLERLVIRNLAVVEHAEVRFGPGLNAVTGETGAGKTLLAQSVSLLVGGRADSDAVREGADVAIVEGEFRLDGEPARRAGELLTAWGHEWDSETVIVRREVSRAGKSRASVNQSPVTLAALRQLGQCLADLHGQHEHQSLLQPDAGAVVLDRLAGLEPERVRIDAAIAAWQTARAAHTQLEASLASFAERGDYLRHAAAELGDAGLVAGEEDSLARDAARLAHADRLRSLATLALDQLSESDASAMSALGAAVHALEQAAALDPGLEPTLPGLREAEIAVSDVSRTLADYTDSLEADPQRLESIEARRDLIARLVRKYRRPLAELVTWRSEIEQELARGDDADGALTRSRSTVHEACRVAADAARSLTTQRRDAAAHWGSKLSRELKPLGMGAARIEFIVESDSEEPAGDLAASPEPAPVHMRFGANPGESARPLQRIASGGELSRVMLALKVALESRDRVDLLFFDEVDSGIGGVVAQAVGERLKRLARQRQIVCVTHLPLIAAMAGHHLRVIKQVSDGRTLARIEPVTGEPRVAELARMLAGDRVTETTRRQARELLEPPVGHVAR